ncbi:hypothetical protein HN481_04005 [Candidatus Parcubacteria bacterium]|jgi:uncharacterized protein|nr:hypothetical protein [Candidatus Parcubacteria bacterium]
MSKNNHKKKTIHISGMTCVSCETIISDELKELDGIGEVHVNHKTQTAEISLTGNAPHFSKIAQKIKKLGYDASEQPIAKKDKKKKATKGQWFGSLAIVFSLYWVYRYFKWIGIFSFMEVDPTNVGFGAAILVGIVASLSTCLAVVGAVVISFGAKYESRGTKFERNIKPHLLFHAGRIGGFFLLGGILGGIGNFFDLSTSVMGWFTVIIAIVLAWLGLNILGFLPSITSVGLHMPKGTMKYWNKLKQSEHAAAPVVLGAFTFFLPCGFTQSMQLFAVGSGSFLIGGLTLAFFALGTAPVLFGVGVVSSKSQKKDRVIFQKVMGFIIIAFAWYTLGSGLAANGVVLSAGNTTTAAGNAPTIVMQDGVQVIEMDVDYRGFTPNKFDLKKDVPVKWIINGKQISGCTNEVIIPEYNISKKLTSGQNIVEFTPTKAGTTSFSCWMGMVRGSFVVS